VTGEAPTTAAPSGRASPRRAGLRALAVATLVATYLLVVLGSTVRVTESGMGCPGWPLCYGKLGPVDSYHALLEQVHRYVAAGVTVAVLATALAAWRQRARALGPALAMVVLVGVQVLLGAVTVVTHNAPATVAAHLVCALLLLGAAAVTVVESVVDPVPPGERPRRHDPLALGALGALLALLASGAAVVNAGAMGACPSWPLCRLAGGTLGPLVALQLLHRSLAALAAVLVARLALRTIRAAEGMRGSTALAGALLAALGAQVAAGAASALHTTPTIADLHLALAAAIWAGTVALVAAPRAQVRETPSPARGLRGTPAARGARPTSP
jgi:heme A synthase